MVEKFSKINSEKAKIIVIGNQKGGCGKTTLSVHLACGLIKNGPKINILVINADLQKSVNMWADNKERFKFDIISGSEDMTSLIEENLNEYNYIIVDCPPATDQSEDSLVTFNSLLLADLLLIPVLCSSLDIWATGNFETTVEEVLEENKRLKVRILLNKFKPRLTRTKRSVSLIKEIIPYPILETKIGDRGAFIDSADFGTTVFELGDRKAINEVNQLTSEILTILKNN